MSPAPVLLGLLKAAAEALSSRRAYEIIVSFLSDLCVSAANLPFLLLLLQFDEFV